MVLLGLLVVIAPQAWMERGVAQTLQAAGRVGVAPAARVRVGRFLRGRGGFSAELMRARREHLAMLAKPRATNLSAAWTAVGPAQVMNPVYGMVTGRVTSIAVDPADASGNTVYLGTTGGGVWKSLDAAGDASAVSFLPLTDTLPVFDLSAGSSALPSLSIGALAVGNGVVLAGTGDPNDATDSYYGEGILRSADGGLTWTLAVQSSDGSNGTHDFVGLAVAGIAFSTANPNVVVAAFTQANEGDVVNAKRASSTMGLYVSSDAGLTWQMATIEDGSQVVQSPTAAGQVGPGNAATAVVWNAVRQKFYAAVRFHGYYESADGMTWTRLASQPGAGLTTRACPVNPGSAGSPSCPIFRGALAVQAVTGDLFALTTDDENNDEGLYQDVCGLASGTCSDAEVVFGTRLDSAPLEVGSGSAEILQADYDMALSAVPAGTDTLLYVGTIDLYRCSLGAGCMLRNTTNAQNGCATPAGVAGAQHAVAAAGGTFFVGNDGGVWRSTDGVAETGGVCSAEDARHFDNLNGGLGSLGEVVDFAMDPVDPGTLLAGLGALGSAGTGTAAGAWAQMATGEGGTVAIDAVNPLNWYVATGAGVNIGACAKGAACGLSDFANTAIGAAQVSGDESEVDAPWLLDPAATGELVVGTCRVWRGPAPGGAAWTSGDLLSGPFAAQRAAGCGAFTVVNSIGVGGVVNASGTAPNLGSEVLYAGMMGGGSGIEGHVFMTGAGATANAATVWTDIGLSPVTNAQLDRYVFNPGQFDVSVVVDAHDATGATVYGVVTGFEAAGGFGAHLYRSVDGGAHWLDVSRNLPNAPANALLVDPNDANTVYVALDTGVYVTTAITTCPTANCWSVYGTGLPNAPVTSLQAAAGMAVGDGRFGMLRAGTYGRGIWSVPLLTAAPPAAPAMTLAPTSVSFTDTQVGTQSAVSTVMVTNSGNASLTVSGVVVSGDFLESDTCVGTPLAVGGSCTVSVVFAPMASGPRSGVLTVYGNVAGGQATASLIGNGLAPASIVLTPGSLVFASTTVGATTAAQNITVANTGGITAGVQSVGVVGDFAISANTCVGMLASQVSCTVSIEFAPAVSGTRNGTLTVVDDAGTQTASLTGVGTNPATDGLAPLALTFAAQQIMTASAGQQVTLTNSGDVALTLVSDTVTGDFTVVNGCGASLAAKSSCVFTVAYVPKSVGAETGVLTISDEFRNQTVTLNGTGLAPPGFTVTPVGGLTFAAAALGTMSAGQTVTVTNNGGVALAISGVAIAGDFAIGANTCGSTVGVMSACTVQVSFSPTVGGTRMGSLTFTDDAGSSPQVIALNGVGVDFSLAADGPASATVSSGETASYLLMLSSAAGVPGDAVFTCSGVPLNAVCTVSPSPTPVYAAGGTVVTVTVGTGIAHAGLVMPWTRQIAWLALLVPVGFLLRRRRALVMLIGVLVLGGCATVGRTIPPGGGGGGTTVVTPSGTYTLVVAGSSGGVVKSVDLTLVVQ